MRKDNAITIENDKGCRLTAKGNHQPGPAILPSSGGLSKYDYAVRYCPDQAPCVRGP